MPEAVKQRKNRIGAKQLPPDVLDPTTGEPPEAGASKSAVALKHFRPDEYAEIVQWLAVGTSARATAKHFNLEYGTIYEIAEREGHSISTKKAEMAQAFRQYAAKGLFMSLEQMDEMSPKDRMITVGIAVDKAAALDGEPGQIIEHRVTHEATPLSDILEASGTVVDVEPATETPAKPDPPLLNS